MEKLIKIQRELIAPKSSRNDFGKYNYRNCEQIFESVKPLLEKYGCTLTISDELVYLGNRYYIKATATITDGNDSKTVTSFAREAEIKKGMDESQITGSASSYARKYALCGLFLIDGAKDADALFGLGHYIYAGEDIPQQIENTVEIQKTLIIASSEANEATTVDELQNVWNKYDELHNNAVFIKRITDKKRKLTTTKNTTNYEEK